MNLSFESLSLLMKNADLVGSRVCLISPRSVFGWMISFDITDVECNTKAENKLINAEKSFKK
jgi:hypothetical protein